MHSRRAFVALLIMTTIVACGTPAAESGLRSPTRLDQPVVTPTEPDGVTQTPPPIDAVLQNTRWTLVRLNGKAPIAGSNITLNVENGQFGGYAGCNWFGTIAPARGIHLLPAQDSCTESFQWLAPRSARHRARQWSYT